MNFNEGKSPGNYYLLYLGRRGAGLVFASKVAELLPLNGAFVSSEVNTLFNRISNLRCLPLRNGPLKYLYYLIFTPRVFRQVRLELEQYESVNVILPMASPMDLRMIRNLKSDRVNIIQILHDAQRHPGDFWPLNSSIKKMVNRSTSLIFLSPGVRKRIESRYVNVTRVREVPHPYFLPSVVNKSSDLPFKYMLLIGRIRKYKGSQNLIKSWMKASQHEDLKNYSLVIAGEGDRLISSKNPHRIIRMNRWLEDSEFDSLIRNAEVVLFPYIEASQSGVLAKAILANKIVAISDLSELKVQSQNYSSKIVIPDFQKKDWLVDLANLLGKPRKSYESGFDQDSGDLVIRSWEEVLRAIKDLSR